MKELFEKWKKFINDMNSRGVPMPMIRDGKTGQASVSLTLVFLSFNIWIVSIVGRWSGQLGGVDPSQTLNMFIICVSLYFGRKFQRDDKGQASFEAEKKE